MLSLGLGPNPLDATLLRAFLAEILVMALRLWRAREPDDEQAAIGLGARLGNGLLLMVLGWLVMEPAGAPAATRFAFGLVLLLAYAGTALALAKDPDRIQIGYRG